jgi:uncharacterized protein YjiS (DUF1127 family)
MLTYATRRGPVTRLFRIAAVMQTGARRMRGAARRLDAWFEKRRPAVAPFETSDHELFDIGIVRIAVPRTAWDIPGATPERAAGLVLDAHARSRAARALIKCSLYLHVGLIGAATLAAGLTQFFDPDATAESALVLGICGGMLAAACWRRAHHVLERADADAVRR